MSWGAVGAAAAQTAFNVGEAFLGDWFSAKATKRAYKYQKRVYKKRYQWTVSDLRKAGLNPILAVRGGLGGGVSAPPAQAAPVGGAGKGALEGVMSALQAKRTLAETKNIEQATKTQKALTWKEQQLGMKEFFNAGRALDEAHTAKAVRRLKDVEADAAEKYGYSVFGRQAFSTEQIIKRLMELRKGSK